MPRREQMCQRARFHGEERRVWQVHSNTSQAELLRATTEQLTGQHRKEVTKSKVSLNAFDNHGFAVANYNCSTDLEEATK